MDVNSFIVGYTKGKQSASGGGGGSMEGFHKVRFFNDDRTTLLYTVFVPTGASAIYAGETPASTENQLFMFLGFEPAPTNITADVDCYAVYEVIRTLEDTEWSTISRLSENRTAQNFFAVGDTKEIAIKGTIGSYAFDTSLLVYIIGFDHNEEIEGAGTHFGTFKNATRKDVALVDGKVGSSVSEDITQYFRMQQTRSASNEGGWNCHARHGVIGSSSTDPVNEPKSQSLLAALPADLRAVMKPMVKWTDCVGGGTNLEENVVETTDYLPLLAEFEVTGTRSTANKYEQYKQKQYDYFKDGAPVTKYRFNNDTVTVSWWLRSPAYNNDTSYVTLATNGYSQSNQSKYSLGLAPIFKV